MTSRADFVVCTPTVLALILCSSISTGHYYYPHHYFAHQSQSIFGFGPHLPFQGWPGPPPPPSVPSQPIWTQVVPSVVAVPKPNIGLQPGPRDLKPSITGWDTAYNVPCGNYSIHPFVIARIRYRSDGRSGAGREHDAWARSNSQISDRRAGGGGGESFASPNNRGRSFSMPGVYHVPASYSKPATCDWNFRAIGPCKLKFTCSWFQMPALFRCDENYIELTDGDTLKYKFCGSRKPRGPYVTPKEMIKLSFRSQPAYSLPTVFDCAVTCAVELVYKDVTLDNPAETGMTKLTNGLLAIPVPTPTPKPELKLADCKCGIRGEPTSLTRIIGGSKTFPGEFPWTVALVRANKVQPFCGGTVLNDRYILTAAHCISARDARFGGSEGPIEVLLNEHDISNSYDNSKPQRSIRSKISKIIVHPKYQNTTYDYDIAILRLAEKIEFHDWKVIASNGNSSSSNSTSTSSPAPTQREKRFFARGRSLATPKMLTPICLPKSREDRSFQDTNAIVTGFGLTKEGGIPSKTMMKATVKIFNDSSCRQFYQGNNVVISDRMLCAGHVLGKMDSCVGDSGGPLVVEDNDRFMLAGIVSWGSGCGRPNKPGVYSKISKDVVEWIQSKTYQDSSWCAE